MSAPALVILVLALLAFGLFVVLAIGIGINGARLMRSAMHFVQEISPEVARISSEAFRAQARATELQERSAEVGERFTKVRNTLRRIGR